MEQRRNFFRMQIAQAATVRRVHADQNHLASTLDISLGGVRLDAAYDFAVNDRVTLTLSLSDFGEVTLTGSVVRRDDRGDWCAIVFDPVRPETERQLSGFLSDAQRRKIAKSAR